MALESPHKLISLEDSLKNTGLSKKNQESLALAHKNIGLNKIIKKDYKLSLIHI